VIESLTGQGTNVQQACLALGVSQSGYYAWQGRPDAPRTLRRIWLAGEIADVHTRPNGTYGALRVTASSTTGAGSGSATTPWATSCANSGSKGCHGDDCHGARSSHE